MHVLITIPLYLCKIITVNIKNVLSLDVKTKYGRNARLNVYLVRFLKKYSSPIHLTSGHLVSSTEKLIFSSTSWIEYDMRERLKYWCGKSWNLNSFADYANWAERIGPLRHFNWEVFQTLNICSLNKPMKKIYRSIIFYS